MEKGIDILTTWGTQQADVGDVEDMEFAGLGDEMEEVEDDGSLDL